MPCRDDGYPDTTAATAAQRATRQAEDRLAPLICSACKALEASGYDFDLNPALAKWWAQHKKEDAARVASEERTAFQERIVTDALKKPFGDLSDEEKTLLKARGYFR